MRWALQIGRTARELLDSITSDELTEMMAFEQIEPFGSIIDDFRAGQVAAVVANVNRDPKTKAQPWTPSDFMPALGAEADRAEDAELAAMTPAQRVALLDAALFKGL